MGTISKALDLLTHFTPARGEIGLTDFVRLSGRDKATVHRHLSELEANGYLEQHPVTRAYRLGPALLRLASVREAAFPVRALISPIVEELADTVRELAHASLLQGDVLSSVAHSDPLLHGTQVYFDMSEVLPLHATSSGLAVLAFSPPELALRVLGAPLERHTDMTETDPAKLRAQIDAVRARGLAQTSGTFDEEVVSQAMPLFGEGGRVIGAIAVAVPSIRASKERWVGISSALQTAARTASLSLGAEPSDLLRP